GRLKKRETEGEPAEWISYERPNRVQAKVSEFTIFSEDQARERFGADPLPVWVVVRKRRELWMHGNTRIHLDEVEGLGTFLEFEAMVSRDHTLADCNKALAELRAHFQPALGELIDCSYSDLIARDQEDAQTVRDEPATE